MTPPNDYTRQLSAMAENEVAELRTRHAVELDFTPDSLATLDDLLADNGAEYTEGERTALAVYVGEIIRRSLGAKWGEDECFGVHLHEIGGVNLMAQPINWVKRRCERGLADSLAAKFALLRERLAGDSKPDEAAVPFTRGGGGNEGPGLEEILVRAPVIMFYLIAAADGCVDSDESDHFRDLLEGYMDIPSPLLQRAIQKMLPRLNQYFAFLASPDFERDEALAELRDILDRKYPDEALGFKEALILLARQIAEASGGFLGFGETVSDEEESALTDLEKRLGLH